MDELVIRDVAHFDTPFHHSRFDGEMPVTLAKVGLRAEDAGTDALLGHSGERPDSAVEIFVFPFTAEVLALVEILDARRFKGATQGHSVEMRGISGTRIGAHVHQRLDAVGLQPPEEGSEWPIRVPDGIQNRGWHSGV